MQDYTVILLTPDYLAQDESPDTRLIHLTAASVEEAELLAKKSEVDRICAEEAPTDADADEDEYEDWEYFKQRIDPDDFLVLYVTEGHHPNIKT